MLYYYGNSYKEALSNDPIEIKTAKQLKSYEDNYIFVIPADEVDEEYTAEELGLPEEVDMPIDTCLADAIEDEYYVEETINDYLSDTYGYCMWSYEYDVLADHIHIYNIEWDTTL